MSKSRFLFLPLLFLILNSSHSSAASTRQEQMQKAMDCLSHQQEIGWQDVCYNSSGGRTDTASSIPAHSREVSDALDTYDNYSTKTFSLRDQVLREAALFQDHSRSAPAYTPEPRAIQPMETMEPRPDPVQVQEHAPPAALKPRVPSEPQQVPLAKHIYDFTHPKEVSGEIGTEYSHIAYKEPIFNLKERGDMYGIYGAYTFRPQKEHELINNDVVNMYRIDGKVSFGQVDYASIDGTIKGIPDYLIELRGVMGYDHYLSPTWRLTPYGGFGYRRLNDDSSGKKTESGAQGYERSANYFYMPVGLEIAHQFDSPWRATATGEIDVLLWGRQYSNLSDVDPSLPDLANQQKRGVGLRSSLELARIGEKYNFLIEPYVRYWHLNDSKTAVAVGPTGIAIEGLEPNNNSTEVGFKLGAQF